MGTTTEFWCEPSVQFACDESDSLCSADYAKKAKFAGTEEINGIAVNLWKWNENLGRKQLHHFIRHHFVRISPPLPDRSPTCALFEPASPSTPRRSDRPRVSACADAGRCDAGARPLNWGWGWGWGWGCVGWTLSFAAIPMNSLKLYTTVNAPFAPVRMLRDIHPFGKPLGNGSIDYPSFAAHPDPFDEALFDLGKLK